VVRIIHSLVYAGREVKFPPVAVRALLRRPSPGYDEGRSQERFRRDMELQNKEEIREEILRSWLGNAWVYPAEGPQDQVFLRVTPGGRLKMRRRIGELESALGVKGADLARQEEEGTLPVEREKMELAMMVQAYTSERHFMESQGATLGSPGIELPEEEQPQEGQ
jgi:hypothetical protein